MAHSSLTSTFNPKYEFILCTNYWEDNQSGQLTLRMGKYLLASQEFNYFNLCLFLYFMLILVRPTLKVDTLFKKKKKVSH